MKNKNIEKIKTKKRISKNQIKKPGKKEDNAKNIYYENILNSIKDGIFICDINYNIIFINKALKKIYGDINNKKCFEYFYGKNKKCSFCNFNKVIKGETIKREWVSPKDKKTYEIIESPLVNKSGSIFKIKIFRDISDRKEKNEKIKDIAKFPFENPNPVIRISKNGKILYSNEPGIKLLKNWSYSVGKTIKEKEARFLKKIYSTKKNKTIEIKFNNKYFSLTFVPVLGNDYINMYGFEITERKLLEIENEKKHKLIENISYETKKQSKELETIFSSISDPIVIYSKNGKVIKMNKAAKKILDFILINMNQNELIEKFKSKTENGKKYIKKSLASSRALKGETVKNEKCFFIDSSGNEKVFEISASPIVIYNKIEGAVIIWHDITEQVIIEKKLKQSHNDLKEEVELKDHEIIRQSELVNKIFSNTHIAIAYLDVNFNFIKVNNAYAKTDNKTSNYFIGKNHFDLFPNKENEKIFKHVLNYGEPFFTYAKPFKYKKNPERGISYWDWSLIPIKDKSNNTEGLILTLLNVTDRIQGQIKLDEAKKELEHSKRLSDIGKLAATVAHELRNPLAVIEVATYNIEKKCKNNNINMHVENINKKINDAEQIISDLLTYAKIQVPVFKKIEIIDLLDECILNMKNNFPDYDVKVIKNYNTKNINIMADPMQIKEVFNNILNNAYQALKNNKGEIKIDLSTIENKFYIKVEDNGIGIEKSDLNKLFEPFFTRKTRGTGLGLSICKEMIELHNGEINISSSIGVGTKVEVILPFKKGN